MMGKISSRMIIKTRGKSRPEGACVSILYFAKNIRGRKEKIIRQGLIMPLTT